MYIGAQLYTVREFTKTTEDFEKTIKKVAAIGYKYVQISAIGPIEPSNVKNICDNYGIEIVLTHTNPDRILNETEAVIEEHNIYGAKYIGLGSIPAKYWQTEENKADGIKRFVDDYLPAAEKIKNAQKLFMYHNHDFEFEKIDGKRMIEMLIEGFPADLMGFTVDVFWVQAGGGDPAYWLGKLAGRVDTIHYKDMALVNRKQVMAEVMEGNLNWDAIYDACKKSGVKWAFVEQDDCYGKDPFVCLETSFKNLTKYLSK